MIKTIEIDELIHGLQGKNLKTIAKASGVNYRTVRDIANSKNKNPTYLVFKKIEFALQSLPCEESQ